MPTPAPRIDLEDRFAGLLLGTAVGDALGLPAENLSAEKIFKRWNGKWKMRFIFGKGMVSDTDTVGAILGALSGAVVGQKGIPIEWLAGIWEWPRSISYMQKIAERLTEQNSSEKPAGSIGCFWPGIVLRNVVFIFTVLVHGFRRMAPPY